MRYQICTYISHFFSIPQCKIALRQHLHNLLQVLVDNENVPHVPNLPGKSQATNLHVSSLSHHLLCMWSQGPKMSRVQGGTSNSPVEVIFSSVRSSNSHPDLLLTQHQHHPLFQITPVLNTGLSLSEPLQLYQRQSLDSSAGYMYTLWVQQDITAR